MCHLYVLLDKIITKSYTNPNYTASSLHGRERNMTIYISWPLN